MSGNPLWTPMWLRATHSASLQGRDGDMTTHLPVGGIIPFPKSEPVDVSPGHTLLLVGFTKVGEQGPDPSLPTTHINVTIPMALTVSPWVRGDPPAFIMGRLLHPLGKTKPGKRSWQVSNPEFQNSLQVARAVWSADRMGEQHAIIYCMMKHERQQNCAKNAPVVHLIY